MGRTVQLASLLVLPLAAASSLAVGTPSRTTAAAPGARVELEVAGVLPMEEDWASVLVLREKGAATLLPVIIPGGDGKALRAALRGGAREPGAGDPESLLDRAIAALGAKVVEVKLEEAEESTRAARVHLVQGAKDLELAARPSESIPLAVAAGVPIVTSRRVLDEAGLSRADLEKLTQRAAETAEDVRL